MKKKIKGSKTERLFIGSIVCLLFSLIIMPESFRLQLEGKKTLLILNGALFWITFVFTIMMLIKILKERKK